MVKIAPKSGESRKNRGTGLLGTGADGTNTGP